MATGSFRQVAVIGIPDAVAGQRVHAVAVPMNKPLDVNAILRTISMKLASYMVPKAIELVDSLPVTPNGKVDYRQLLSQRVSI